MLDFFISTCADMTVCRETIECIQAIEGYKYAWMNGAGAGACRPKNGAMTHWLLKDDSPYLISVDRDIIFTQKHIDLLIEDLRESDGMTIFGGCYVVRDGSQLACSSKPDKSPIMLDGRMEEVKWMSTGFLGVSRRLVQKMVKELSMPLLSRGVTVCDSYPFFEDKAYLEPGEGWMWLSEDYDFSRKARLVGARVLLDTRIWVAHLGSMKWTVEAMLAREKTLQAEK